MSTRKLPLRSGLQARLTALAAIGLAAVFVAIGLIGLRNQAASMGMMLEQRQAPAEAVASHCEKQT